MFWLGCFGWEFLLQFVKHLVRAILYRGAFYANFGLEGVRLKWQDCELSVKIGVGSITKRSLEIPIGKELILVRTTSPVKGKILNVSCSVCERVLGYYEGKDFWIGWPTSTEKMWLPEGIYFVCSDCTEKEKRR